MFSVSEGALLASFKSECRVILRADLVWLKLEKRVQILVLDNSRILKYFLSELSRERARLKRVLSRWRWIYSSSDSTWWIGDWSSTKADSNFSWSHIWCIKSKKVIGCNFYVLSGFVRLCCRSIDRGFPPAFDDFHIKTLCALVLEFLLACLQIILIVRLLSLGLLNPSINRPPKFIHWPSVMKWINSPISIYRPIINRWLVMRLSSVY